MASVLLLRGALDDRLMMTPKMSLSAVALVERAGHDLSRPSGSDAMYVAPL